MISKHRPEKTHKKKKANIPGHMIRPGRPIFPTRWECTLTFHVVHVFVTTALTPFAGTYYIPTYAYDIDPSIGSTAVPFFTELGAIERKYRVKGSRAKAHFSNTDLPPASCFLVPVNYVPTFGSTGVINSYFSNPFAKVGLCGPSTGSSNCSLSNSATTAGFSASKYTGTEDEYCAQTSGAAPPVNNWYWALGVQTNVSANAGVYVDLVLEIDILFYEPSTPAS